MKWKIYLARHWETEANITKSIVWITDVSLTQKWYNDAYHIGINIGNEIDLIITSPQKRALVTSELIRKYNSASVVEYPILHPQNFWEIEWLTLFQAKQKWLEHCLHTKDTHKYTHKSQTWESAQEMESRVLPEIMKIINYSKLGVKNILLLTHNSIARCLIGNINNLPPEIWLENNIWNQDIYMLDTSYVQSIPTHEQHNQNHICILLDKLFEVFDFNTSLPKDFLSDFSRISLHQEHEVIDYLQTKFSNNLNNYHVINLLKLLNNTIDVNNMINEINQLCEQEAIYSVLYFGSTVYGKNYSIKDGSDLDIELIIDEKFDISQLKNNILSGYAYGDIEEHFQDFLLSNSDYFSFKAYYKWRPIDYRITKKNCFDKICDSSLMSWEEYMMKEFRKQYRENGIIACRKSFNWECFSWDNEIEYTKEWQIINYPLYKYTDWKFVWWNNIDKYCSFTDVYKNETEIKKKLFQLRKTFLNRFNAAKSEGQVPKDIKISDIFIRKDRFPKYLQEDLEARYELYNLLCNF